MKCQFNWWRKPEHPEEPTDLRQEPYPPEGPARPTPGHPRPGAPALDTPPLYLFLHFILPVSSPGTPSILPRWASTQNTLVTPRWKLCRYHSWDYQKIMIYFHSCWRQIPWIPQVPLGVNLHDFWKLQHKGFFMCSPYIKKNNLCALLIYIKKTLNVSFVGRHHKATRLVAC